MNREDNEEISKFLYKQSVRGYEFNINRYKDWMNLYAVFVGAFFIAYYTLIGKGNIILSLIIVLLGLATSFCWFFSFQGYYNWQKSWIQILHYHESLFLENANFQVDNKNKYRVYSVAIDNGKLYSSQKIIEIFLQIVIVGWSILLIKELLFLIIKCCLCSNIYAINNCIYKFLCPCIVIIFILVLLLILIIYWLKKEILKKILSDIDTMYKLEKIKLDDKKSVYRVIKPKEEIVVNEKES